LQFAGYHEHLTLYIFSHFDVTYHEL
jgi:hypothetical protein